MATAEIQAALIPGPAQKDKNNWAPRVGFNWSPRSSNAILGDGKTVFRGGFGMGYDVIFYNLLTVNASNYPRVVTASVNNVQNVYPNLLPVSGSPVSAMSPISALKTNSLSLTTSASATKSTARTTKSTPKRVNGITVKISKTVTTPVTAPERRGDISRLLRSIRW
mgnify:CR=1 FL=1